MKTIQTLIHSVNGDKNRNKNFAGLFPNPFPVFYEWYITKLLSPWPNITSSKQSALWADIDYGSVSIGTIIETLFFLMSDTNASIRIVCREYIKRFG